MAQRKPAAVPDPEIAKLVDEIGDLDRELSPFSLKITRLDKARRELRDKYEDKSADAFYVAKGSKYDIQVGPKSNETHIDTQALFDKVGATVFVRIAHVTVKALEQCERGIVRAVSKLKPTGHRSIKIFEKGQAPTL